jgi:hypothetical protein
MARGFTDGGSIRGRKTWMATTSAAMTAEQKRLGIARSSCVGVSQVAVILNI